MKTFREKTFKTLTKQSGGILGAEIYVSEKGLNAYSAVVDDPDYYLAKADRELWVNCLQEIPKIIPDKTPVTEYGPGDSHTSVKTAGLVQSIGAAKYTGIDVSQSSIDLAIANIRRIKSDIETEHVLSDFFDENIPCSKEASLALFAGCTIENFEGPVLFEKIQDDLTRVLSLLGERTKEGWLLISFDILEETLSAESYLKAYRSSAHTAFNLSIFDRMRDELQLPIGADDFEYRADFDPETGNISHNAFAKRSLCFSFDGAEVNIRTGDVFHIQNSLRLRERFIRECTVRAGFETQKVWKHPTATLQLHLIRCKSGSAAEETNRQSRLRVA